MAIDRATVVLIFSILCFQQFPMFLASFNCKYGTVYVTCDLQLCNSSALLPVAKAQTGIQLFYHGRFISSSKEHRYTKFSVDLQNVHLERFLNFACSWTDSIKEYCRYNVSIDGFTIPPPPQNVWFWFSKGNGPLDRVVNLKFDIPFVKRNISSQAASVYAMKLTSRNCPVKIENAQVSESKPCLNHNSKVICPNFLRQHASFEGIYAAVAVIRNKAGTCKSKLLCRRITFPDIYGNIENVSLASKIVNQIPQINISWVPPAGLAFVAPEVLVSIKYCELQSYCNFQNETMKIRQQKVVFSEITKGIKYNTRYSVQLSYSLKLTLFPNLSPWTKPKEIVTLSKLPTKPMVIECTEQNKKFKLRWENESREQNVIHYLIRIEASVQKEILIQFPSSNCTQAFCSFSIERPSPKESFRLTLISCSNGGCNYIDVAHCTFRQSLQFWKPSEHGDSSTILILTVSPLSIAVLSVLFFIGYYIYRKRREQEANLFIVYPRLPSSDRINQQVPSDHTPYSILY